MYSSSPALKHGQSLFREVPANRTCEDAGIPEHYCTCEHAKPVDLNDTHLLKASKEVVKELNRGLRTFPDCSQLTLDKVSKHNENFRETLITFIMPMTDVLQKPFSHRILVNFWFNGLFLMRIWSKFFILLTQRQ